MTNCIASTEEYADVAMFYVYTFQKPMKIIFNMIYNAGDIYDSSASLVELSKVFMEMDLEQTENFGA
jgi:hypothetical protein